MKEKRVFELAFIIQNSFLNLDQIKEFLKTAKAHFSKESILEIQIFSWIGSNTIGILFRFDFDEFRPSFFQWFQPWIAKLKMEVVELEKLGIEQKNAFINKCMITTDIKFTGTYELFEALDVIEERFKETKTVRKSSRIPYKIKVTFKSEDAFYKEYSENISYGGMFIVGKTNLPLRSRIEITFVLPDKEEIKAIAEIIHIISKEEKKVINGNAIEGFGVQFVEYIGDGKDKLKKYFEDMS